MWIKINLRSAETMKKDDGYLCDKNTKMKTREIDFNQIFKE